MSEGNGSAPGGRATIRIGGLTKSFGAQTVVNIDELVLGSAPVEGLIGPNGAGKTTLMRLIMRSTRADTGTVVLDGRHLGGGAVEDGAPPHRLPGAW